MTAVLDSPISTTAAAASGLGAVVEGRDQMHTVPDNSAAAILRREISYSPPMRGADLEAYLESMDLREARLYVRDLVQEMYWVLRHRHEVIVLPAMTWAEFKELSNDWS